MKATRITEWTTDDGRTHRDHTVAKKHAAWLDLVEWCHNFMTKTVSNEAYPEAAARNLVSDREEIVRLLRKAEEAPE